MDSQPRTSTRVSQSLNGGILPPQVRSSITSGRSSRGSQMSSRGSLVMANRSSSSYPPDLNESRGTIEDTVKLRIVTKTIHSDEFQNWCLVPALWLAKVIQPRIWLAESAMLQASFWKPPWVNVQLRAVSKMMLGTWRSQAMKFEAEWL